MRGFLLAGAIVLGASGAAWATGYQDFNLGISANNRDDSDAAIQSLTRALAEPDLPGHLKSTALVARGDAYSRKKQYDKAIADFTAALAAKPDNAAARADRAKIYADADRYAESIADYSQLIRTDPYQLNLYMSRLFVYAKSSDYADAIADCHAILARWPTQTVELKPPPEALFHWLCGSLYLVQGQYDSTIAEDTEAISLNDDLAAAYGDRGRARLLKGQFKEARDDLKEGLDDSDKPIVSNASLIGGVDLTSKANAAVIAQDMGFCDWNIGRFDRATTSFARALKISAHDAYAVLGLAISNAKNGSTEDLAKDAASVDLGKWPGPVLALWLGKSTPGQVLSLTSQGASSDMDWKKCEANFYIGEWQLAHNDPASARVSLQAAVSNCPPNVDEVEAAQTELGRMQNAEIKP